MSLTHDGYSSVFVGSVFAALLPVAINRMVLIITLHSAMVASSIDSANSAMHMSANPAMITLKYMCCFICSVMPCVINSIFKNKFSDESYVPLITLLEALNSPRQLLTLPFDFTYYNFQGL